MSTVLYDGRSRTIRIIERGSRISSKNLIAAAIVKLKPGSCLSLDVVLERVVSIQPIGFWGRRNELQQEKDGMKVEIECAG